MVDHISLLIGPVVLDIDAPNLHTIRTRIDTLGKRMTNLRPVMANADLAFFTSEREIFGASGLPDPWPPLSPAYNDWKAVNYPGQPILRRTDRLYDSLISQTPDTIFEYTDVSAAFGTAVPYSDYHQTGTSRMPRRPPLGFTQGGLDVLEAMLEAHLTDLDQPEPSGVVRDSRGRFMAHGQVAPARGGRP